MKKVTAFILLSFLLAVPAVAGSPPAACNSADSGCSLASDILVFAEGDAVHQIVARITGCDECIDNFDGTFQLMGDAEIDWGPYDPAQGPDCAPANATTHLFLSYETIQPGAGGGGPGGNEATYIPTSPTAKFHPDVLTPLKTACIHENNLAYEIPWVELTGADGAVSGTIAGGDEASLHLPEPVRAEEGGALLSSLQIEQFGFTQGLTFTTARTEGPSSTLRFWPDGLPFKLGPHITTFTEANVSFTTDSGIGPAPYTPFPPRAGNLTTQVRICDAGIPSSKPDGATDPCTTGSISNGGYFDSTDWYPSVAPSFDNDGMDVVLGLPLGSHVTYESLFPRGVWTRLEGPASVTINDGAIETGAFNDGTAWLRIQDGHLDLCGKADRERTFPLRSGAGAPQIGVGGSLLAAVEDLTAVEPIDWAAHEADGLDCGTLYVPPLLADPYPQVAWNQSAVPTVLDRGVYAGINYNRNRVCHDSMGSALEQTCAANSDCDTGAGQYCADGGFSPLCDDPGAIYDPRWNTEIEGVAHSFPIDPGNPAQGDREMAFVARRSGVTGVFDGGDDPFTIVNPNDLHLEFDTYGLAFRESRTAGQDTIVRGGVVFLWPSDTTVPFEEMSVCDCGSLDSGKAPDLLVENNLGYWNATFFPYGLQFTDEIESDGTCPAPDEVECGFPSVAVCVTALTPIPRFEPDPTSLFPILANGQTETFTPLSQPRLEFDRDREEPDLAAPYTYDIEHFRLNDWTLAGAPSFDDVVVYKLEPYGHYEISGDLSMPYFGLTASGIQVMTQDVAGVFHNPVNLFDEGNILNSYVVASRAIAADTVPVSYKVDYFTPSATADPGDGSDIKFRGRGSLFAFADEPFQDLGSVEVAGGMIMNPEGIVHNAADLGPAAALRLWGATDSGHRNQLDNIIPSIYVNPYSGMYTDALAELLSERGYSEYALPDPATLKQDLHDTGAIDYLAGHEYASILFNVDPNGLSPPLIGEKVTGHMQFSTPDPDQVESFLVTSNQNTGGEFYSVEGSLLQVDRHVKQDKMPITTVSREDQPGASQNMAMPGEQSIAFPGGGGGAKSGGSFFPGIEWDIDFDMPGFEFKSMTGSLDLTQGGLSGVGFDELCATLGFWADGDWYFDAGIKLNFNGYGVKGGVLLGNTVDMTPLKNRDPDVADFLSGVTQFDGAYLGLGLKANLFDYGCFFRVNVGAEVAGWYISQSFGGKVRGFITGEGACLVSVRGDMTLMGGEVNDAYRVGGHFWVAGGAGFCDPGDWDTPGDVLDDDFCAACVFDCKAFGTWPPEDMEIKLIGPDVDCSL